MTLSVIGILNMEIRKDLFNKQEKQYLQDKSKLNHNIRSTVKRRLKKKIILFKDNNFYKAFGLLDDKDKKRFCSEIILNLPTGLIKEIFKEYQDFLIKSSKNAEIIKSWNKKERLDYEEVIDSLNLRDAIKFTSSKLIKDKKSFEKKLWNSYKQPEAIVKAKLTGDWVFIAENKFRKELYQKLVKIKKPIKIKYILLENNRVIDKETIKDFYKRGIILEKSISVNKYLKLCLHKAKTRNFIVTKKKEKNDSDFYEVYMDVFRINKGFQEKFIVLNSLHKDIDMEYYSKPKDIPLKL